MAKKRYTMNMKKILITRKLADNVIQKLSNDFELDIWNEESPIPREELLRRVPGKDGILCLLTEKIDHEVLESAGSSLKVVSTMSVGYDHIDTAELKNRGVRLGFTPDVLTGSVADLTVALMLNAGRRIKEASDAAIKGEWAYWKPYWLNGYDITGSIVGIVGFGRIGKAVAKRLKGFDCKIYYFDIKRDEQAEIELGIEYKNLEDLLITSDFVTLHVAPTKDTMNMINKQTLVKMKNTAVLVNTSRGSLVNTDDLYEALTTGQIFAAGLDTINPEPLPVDHPLFKLPNCIIVPHIASSTFITRDKMGILAAENLIAGLNEQPMPKEVSL